MSIDNQLDSKHIYLSRNYWLLFFGKIVSQLGEGIFSIALPWYLLTSTGSARTMSMYPVLQNVTLCVCLLLTNNKIDVWRRERVLYVTDFIRGGYLLLLFALVTLMPKSCIYFVIFSAIVLSASASAFNPASIGIVPLIVEKKALVKANSLLGIVDNTIVILGIAVGVPIYEILGMNLILLISGVAYVFSGISEMFIHVDYEKEHLDRAGKSAIESLRGTMCYLFSNRIIITIVLFALSWNFIYIAMHSIYLPYLFNVELHSNIGSLAIIEVFEGVGLVFGATMAGRINIKSGFHNNLTKVVFVQLPIYILFPVVLLLNRFFINSVTFVSGIYTCLFFVLGITVAIVNVNVNVIIQSDTDPKYIGRISSVKQFGSNVSMAIALFLGGVFIGLMDAFQLLSINAILFVLLCAFMYFKMMDGGSKTNHNIV